MKENKKIYYIIGLIPVILLALVVAPFINGGLIEFVKEFSKAIENPLRLTFCTNSIKVSLIFMLVYGIGITMWNRHGR